MQASVAFNSDDFAAIGQFKLELVAQTQQGSTQPIGSYQCEFSFSSGFSTVLDFGVAPAPSNLLTFLVLSHTQDSGITWIFDTSVPVKLDSIGPNQIACGS